MQIHRYLAMALLISLAGCSSSLPGNDTDWAKHGYGDDEQRFSPLAQIDKTNISDLDLEWYHDLDTRRGQEATPIVVDGIMYTTSAWSKVQAFDARNGKILWQYDPEVPREWAVRGCCDVVNRGVAYHEGKVYFGSFDGRLIALDAKSGKPVWATDTIVDRSKFYTITGAPRVVKGRVLIGNGGGEFGVRGYISAYDAKTGKLDWRFYTVPGEPGKKDGAASDAILEKLADETWSGKYWEQGGGGTVWDSMAYDAELDLLYIGVGNGSPWNPAIRSPGGGDNLFLSSILALRPESGEYVWHYQTTPGDQWDFTATQHMILADLDIDGKSRKVIMQAPKNGFFYVIDRETGEFLSGEPFVPVTWAKGIDKQTGRPNIVADAYYHKTGNPWDSKPGPMGGHNWHPMSYNPDTGLVYIPAQELSFPYIADENFKRSDLAVNLGIDLAKAALPSDQKIRDQVRRSLKGSLLAWDPVKQKEVWRVEHGGPWNGGTLTTAGNLVFQGNRNGELVAYDAADGTKLWSTKVHTGIVAPPISYAIDGEQYVAVVAGWGGIFPLLLGELSHNEAGAQVNRSRVLVYKLGGKAKLPHPVKTEKAAFDLPKRYGSAATLKLGAKQYARYCAGCHGDTAVSGGVLPDLRHSIAISERDIWESIILEGALTDAGMVGFSKELSFADADAIRAYVVSRAHESAEKR
jgi:quinohemoprotein ethanol dehydrogenase